MCLFPQRAQKQEFGKPILHPEGDICLPCGKCTECVSKRACEWAIRAGHEISMHDENCFLTLTYDDEHLPSVFLVKEDFQKFMKRLRKKLKHKVRYIVSGEYGTKSFRPHFHAIIFGYNPPNQKFIMNSPSGSPLFTSPEISALWDKGFHSIGTANERSAYYIASYAMKGKKHTIADPESGELVDVVDYMDSSKRPAIGKEYFLQNREQIINSGNIVPRYYLKLLEKEDLSLLEQHQSNLAYKARSSHNFYAKYILDQQKLAMSDGFLRSAPEEKPEDIFYKKHLKTQRDWLAEKEKENAKANLHRP